MEKMEKIINGNIKRVTISVYDYEDKAKMTIEKIMKMKPEPVRVEKTNTRVLHMGSNFRSDSWSPISDIVISL